MKIARVVALVVCVAISSNGFWPDKHRLIIDESFHRVQGVDRLASRSSAMMASSWVDVGLNDDPNQYRHSMRPSNQSLQSVEAHTDSYIQEQLADAIDAARAKHSGVAGWHLGLMLHAIQDGKHNFVSCSPASNGSDSSNSACDSSRPGCPKGMGNHGLTSDCLLPDLQASNDQRRTDHYPTAPQLIEAEDRGVHFLNEFLNGASKP